METFLREIPDVDLYVNGPTYEGERALLNVVERFLSGGCRKEAVFEDPVAGGVWIDPRSGGFARGPAVEQIDDLDSPQDRHHRRQDGHLGLQLSFQLGGRLFR